MNTLAAKAKSAARVGLVATIKNDLLAIASTVPKKENKSIVSLVGGVAET